PTPAPTSATPMALAASVYSGRTPCFEPQNTHTRRRTVMDGGDYPGAPGPPAVVRATPPSVTRATLPVSRRRRIRTGSSRSVSVRRTGPSIRPGGTGSGATGEEGCVSETLIPAPHPAARPAEASFGVAQ